MYVYALTCSTPLISDTARVKVFGFGVGSGPLCLRAKINCKRANTFTDDGQVLCDAENNEGSPYPKRVVFFPCVGSPARVWVRRGFYGPLVRRAGFRAQYSGRLPCTNTYTQGFDACLDLRGARFAWLTAFVDFSAYVHFLFMHVGPRWCCCRMVVQLFRCTLDEPWVLGNSEVVVVGVAVGWCILKSASIRVVCLADSSRYIFI